MANGRSVLRSQMAPAFLKVYAAAGGDLPALIAAHGLPPDAATLREFDLSLDALDAVANAAAARANDPNLGLHLAIRLPPGSYGLLEYIGRSAGDVRRAGERFLRYTTLLNDLVRFGFERRGEVVVLSQRVEGQPKCVGRHAGEMFIALVVRYLREITASDWSPVRVGFAHAAPANTAEHEAWFGAPLVWERGKNFVELPASLLDRPVVSRDDRLFSMLDAQAEALLVKPHDDLAKVKDRIRAALADGQPQLAAVARSLRMSPRTLQRRLGDRKTSFQDLVDAVRADLARVYMADKEKRYTIGELAYLLGFSEISALSRAFKRWTGMTPRQWRDRSNHLA